MKNLFMIGGPMGVGKTSAAQQLKKLMPNSVFLDGDWCWDADPFQVTTETKEMVIDNICHLLNNFLRCSAYENVIFCWVMHQQDIIDGILAHLDTADCRVQCVSLVASPETLRTRLQADITVGVRNADIIDRSLARLPLYNFLNTHRIDTSALSPFETAQCIANIQEDTNAVHP